MDTLHGHPHGQGQGHPYIQPEAPATEGRLIRCARLYDPLVWLMSLGWTRALRSLPLDLAAIRPGERVLDVGCGTGDLTLAVARRVGPGGTVFGIDASPEMVAVARRKALRARRGGAPARFRVEPVEALSFPDASFDVVLSSLMMHHLPGDLKSRALAEIRRVLRPGGRVLIVDWDWLAAGKPPRLWQPGGLAAHRHGHGRTQQMSSVQEGQTGVRLEPMVGLLRENGFVHVESGPFRFDWMGYALGRMPE